jgi:hypothetical protein
MSSGIATKYGLYLMGETTNYLSGNVGIGTATSSAILEINSTGSAAALNITSDTGSSILFVNDSNIVIGNANPQSLLDVNGAANFTGVIDTSGLTINGTQGLTDSTSYWLCTAADCSTKCQVTITNGLITGCA